MRTLNKVILEMNQSKSKRGEHNFLNVYPCHFYPK